MRIILFGSLNPIFSLSVRRGANPWLINRSLHSRLWRLWDLSIGFPPRLWRLSTTSTISTLVLIPTAPRFSSCLDYRSTVSGSVATLRLISTQILIFIFLKTKLHYFQIFVVIFSFLISAHFLGKGAKNKITWSSVAS
jgi:hypothetical protein